MPLNRRQVFSLLILVTAIAIYILIKIAAR